MSSQLPGGSSLCDQAAINYSPSQAATTSYTASGVQSSSIDDNASVYTFNSIADAGKFVKEVEGRMFNVLNDTYFLPADVGEWTRLSNQHVVFKMGLSNQLYPAPEVVRAVLKPETGVTKRILDLGSGTGVWCTEIAREFPHADVLGVDLALGPVDEDNLPPNCRFEIDDINLGLSHFAGQFDLVHTRMISTGITNFRKSVVEMENCLRPGGMIIWVDIDFDMYANGFSYREFATDENPGGSWFQRFAYEMRREALKGGSDLFSIAAGLDKGFWSHEQIDPGTCKAASLYIPLGPWAQGPTETQTQQLRYAGALLGQTSMSVYGSVQSKLVQAGWPAETVAEWERKSLREMTGRHEPLWARFMLAWGRKREAPGRPAPALPTLEDSPLDPFNVPYPAYYVYDTPEQSQRQAAIRNSKKNIPPPPEAPVIKGSK